MSSHNKKFRLRVSFHAFRAKALFGFQAIPVVQDVCTDESDPKRKVTASIFDMSASIAGGRARGGLDGCLELL